MFGSAPNDRAKMPSLRRRRAPDFRFWSAEPASVELRCDTKSIENRRQHESSRVVQDPGAGEGHSGLAIRRCISNPAAFLRICSNATHELLNLKMETSQ